MKKFIAFVLAIGIFSSCSINEEIIPDVLHNTTWEGEDYLLAFGSTSTVIVYYKGVFQWRGYFERTEDLVHLYKWHTPMMPVEPIFVGIITGNQMLINDSFKIYRQ